MSAIVSSEVLRLSVNGHDRELLVKPYSTLLEVLREDLRLTGTKHGCEAGECGACMVLVDGIPKLSCLVLPAQVEGAEVTTIEGIGDGSDLHPVQQAFINRGAVQCGYCTPAMVLAAKALLDANPAPSREEIKEALAGNLCRCTGYVSIVEAVEEAGMALA
ncbi:MAG: (2Fe-2S)-binding protein [Acidimicrobiales bacterium]|jgi:carbon-monoxide dehydrogenase small subunit|nr:(2Fe-2S)-binding protein [Actinomycetota bacterium]